MLLVWSRLDPGGLLFSGSVSKSVIEGFFNQKERMRAIFKSNRGIEDFQDCKIPQR